MRKILLLENKDSRQKGFHNKLKKYPSLNNILGDENCNSLLDQFLEKQSIFDDYDTIIIHESIYYDEKREELFCTLTDFCREKNLVKFSGNNRAFSLESDKLLQLSSKLLYENIEVFLEAYQENNSHILMLALGKRWYLNIFLNSLEKLNLFLENNKKEKMQKSIFSSKSGLTKIKEVSPENYSFLFQEINSNQITKEQMESIVNRLKKLIQDKTNE